MPNSNFNRRHFLRGFTLGSGATLLAPILAQLEAHAAGAAIVPKRFVFVTVSNGLNPSFIQPKNLERDRRNIEHVVDMPLARLDLPLVLEPLAPFKDRLTILQGLSGRICGGGHFSSFGALGVYPGVKKGAMAETIDLALSRTRSTIFPHVGLEVASGSGTTVNYQCSASDPGKPVGSQCWPDMAYDNLFGSIAAGGDARAIFQARGNLLDFLTDDIKRVESRLVGEERERFGSYLQAYESMRDRRSRLNEIESTLRARTLERHSRSASRW